MRREVKDVKVRREMKGCLREKRGERKFNKGRSKQWKKKRII